MCIMRKAAIGGVLIISFLIFVALFFLLFHNPNEDLGGGYTYYSEQKFISGDYEIPPVVLEYKYNDNVIVVKQRPMKHGNIMYAENNYYLGRDTIYYWIIEKNSQKIIGPTDQKSFLKKVSDYHDNKIMIH